MRSTAENLIPQRLVPTRFEQATFDTYEPRTKAQGEALEAARSLIDPNAPNWIENLVLVGSPGLGKTHLAAAIVNALVARDVATYNDRIGVYRDKLANGEDARHPASPTWPVWINVADAVSQLRFEMDYPLDDRDMTRRVQRARSHSGLLVLDDLGREKTSDWTGELIYALVNHRYEEDLSTVVTSNLSPTDLAASPYWPAVSRLAEDGQLVKLDGADYRLR